MTCLLSCSRHDQSPQLAFESANQAFIHGELQQSKDEAKKKYEEFRKPEPGWAAKFRILEAKAALWQGLFDEALSILQSEPQPSQPDLSVAALTIAGTAYAHLQQFSAAENALNKAAGLCSVHTEAVCGEVLQARGLLASEQNNSSLAERLFEQAHSFAVTQHDPFLTANALLNLSAESLGQGRFDEMLDRSEAAVQAAQNAEARVLELAARGNVGWAYYRLGETEKALGLFLEAEKRAGEFADFVDQGGLLTYAGYVYMDTRRFPLAESSFQHALAIETRVNRKEYIWDALRALARLSLLTGDLDKANQYADLALHIDPGNRLYELYPTMVQGQVAARRGNVAGAKQKLEAVEQDKLCPVFLKWEAQHVLAQIYENERNPEAANREYRAALATFESARDSVRHEEVQLSFLTNAAGIYDDYVHFLVAQGKINDALRWADFDRARTLAEGLGLLSKKGPLEPAPLNSQAIARREKGALLFYWLGEKQSYLWAISLQRTALFTLPPGHVIDDAVHRLREAMAGTQDILDSANQDAALLYRTLVAPAQSLLGKQGRVFIIPDGSLNNLNFETLLVTEPQPHYWIEDATITNASSLRLLVNTNQGAKNLERNLLLMGNSVAAGPKYPELPKASIQVENVAQHFQQSHMRMLTREHATPAAYLNSKLEQFSHIHFVAHGTASRLSPLDSAIILSKSGTKEDSFKLYARDIVRHPLRAELVTISACYGAGERTYSGEGLVGLSWAFLKAGAHNVVAALWEATDSSTEELMSRFYDELGKGVAPDAALRAAKLSLLHRTSFRDPFYWAPFQLYAGSYRNADPRSPDSPPIATETLPGKREGAF
jgi:CHAT domain-containing protein